MYLVLSCLVVDSHSSSYQGGQLDKWAPFDFARISHTAIQRFIHELEIQESEARKMMDCAGDESSKHDTACVTSNLMTD